VLWFFLVCLSLCVHSDVLADDSAHHLDQIIDHWIYKIPNLIDDSVFQSEKDLRLTVAKRVTQGWSIVLASWKDILSDYIANDRTLGNLGDDYTVVYNYGFLFSYGIGFGYPLLLSLPEETKSCGRQDFLNTLYEYELQNGVQGLLARGASNSDVASILTEFETIISTKLNCLSNDENIESMKALNAVKNLIAAMNARSTITTARLANTNNVYYEDHLSSQAKSFPTESIESSNEIGSTSDSLVNSSSSSAEYES